MYINLIITTWKHFGTNNVVRILVLLPVAALHQILCSFVLKIKEIKISMGHSYVGTMIRFWDSAHKYIDSDRHQGVLFFPLASMLYLFPIFHQYQVEFHFRKKRYDSMWLKIIGAFCWSFPTTSIPGCSYYTTQDVVLKSKKGSVTTWHIPDMLRQA